MILKLFKYQYLLTISGFTFVINWDFPKEQNIKEIIWAHALLVLCKHVVAGLLFVQ